MIHKPVPAPEIEDWEDEYEECICPHDLPLAMNCSLCEEMWINIAIWGEVLDEA